MIELYRNKLGFDNYPNSSIIVILIYTPIYSYKPLYYKLSVVYIDLHTIVVFKMEDHHQKCQSVDHH